MTWTYTPSSSPDDVTKVRYYLGDTVEDAAMFTDEEITMAVALEGGVPAAVISLIRSAMARLAHEPDMTADWLRIDWRRSAENWAALLKQRKAEFGLGARAVSGYQHAYRADSYQDTAPDWNTIFRELEDDDDFEI
jgi:hypothetical protein